MLTIVNKYKSINNLLNIGPLILFLHKELNKSSAGQKLYNNNLLIYIFLRIFIRFPILNIKYFVESSFKRTLTH